MIFFFFNFILGLGFLHLVCEIFVILYFIYFIIKEKFGKLLKTFLDLKNKNEANRHQILN